METSSSKSAKASASGRGGRGARPTTEPGAPEPLIDKITKDGPIPVAYALVPDPDHPGQFFDVCLRNVYAESAESLERSARSSKPAFGLMRIEFAMHERHRVRGWAR